jgi:bombesin-like receptor 3
MVMVAVWVASALYSLPRLIWTGTATNNLPNGVTETMCIPHRVKYDSKLFDMINFTVLYVVPLSVITVLYSLIAMTLWHSSHGPERHCRTNGSAAAAKSK